MNQSTIIVLAVLGALLVTGLAFVLLQPPPPPPPPPRSSGGLGGLLGGLLSSL